MRPEKEVLLSHVSINIVHLDITYIWKIISIGDFAIVNILAAAYTGVIEGIFFKSDHNKLENPIINMFHNELCKIWVSKILSRWVTTVSAVSLKEDQAKKYKWEQVNSSHVNNVLTTQQYVMRVTGGDSMDFTNTCKCIIGRAKTPIEPVFG